MLLFLLLFASVLKKTKGLTRRSDMNPERNEPIYGRGWKGGLWKQVSHTIMTQRVPPGVFKTVGTETWRLSRAHCWDISSDVSPFPSPLQMTTNQASSMNQIITQIAWCLLNSPHVYYFFLKDLPYWDSLCFSEAIMGCSRWGDSSFCCLILISWFVSVASEVLGVSY
jgi:hypothetical protein